ncbi:hypothetical protein GO013_16265 [Pseudodesulfovibrio sp. JC047]|uniref:nSTAND1 domain-containing NTPase n=1 Tax=Pseudodesulfovibrio sp. JC047 TaxID=2683199 RepID=UPI0013D21E52|nr:hypothetical protein [Pseudodesulfovibrio sp. JC047]NDV20967.1 hypothetical protein [Pseudodesulfovibrio sp. JC047]
MTDVNVFEIFTPTVPAKLTFVERQEVNNKLVDALRTPGKQIVVYGNSGCGKSTLLINKLNQLYENHITTRCMDKMTFDQIVLDAFDQLNIHYISEQKTAINETLGTAIKADYLAIKLNIDASLAIENETTSKRALPIQLTPQRLATFIGALKCCWVIEDFHKVNPEEKKRFSQMMKVFMDTANEYPMLKTIAIGAVGTAREVVNYDNEMRTRVSEIHVSQMKSHELEEIISKGEIFLNISFSKNAKRNIIHHCNGLASVCHQLSLNCCLDENILKNQETKRTITNETLQHAIKKYIEEESDSIKMAFDTALKRHREVKYDNCRLILEALTKANENGMSHAEILKEIKNKSPEYPASNLTIYLKELQTEKRSSIVRMDQASGKFLYSNPFHKTFATLLFVSKEDIDHAQIDKLLPETSKIFETFLNIIKEELKQ